MNYEGETAFHIASKIGPHEIVQMLIARKADINMPTEGDKKTALHIACENENVILLKELLLHRADTSTTDFQKSTPLHYILANG